MGSFFNTIQIMIDYVFEINTFGKLAGVYNLWCDFNHVLLGVTLFLIIKKVYIRFLRENACLGSILNAVSYTHLLTAMRTNSMKKYIYFYITMMLIQKWYKSNLEVTDK